MYKKGTQRSGVTVASTVYSCTECDYTQMDSGDGITKCPVCKADMIAISGSCEEKEED